MISKEYAEYLGRKQRLEEYLANVRRLLDGKEWNEFLVTDLRCAVEEAERITELIALVEKEKDADGQSGKT